MHGADTGGISGLAEKRFFKDSSKPMGFVVRLYCEEQQCFASVQTLSATSHSAICIKESFLTLKFSTENVLAARARPRTGSDTSSGTGCAISVPYISLCSLTRGEA